MAKTREGDGAHSETIIRSEQSQIDAIHFKIRPHCNRLNLKSNKCKMHECVFSFLFR